MFHIYRSWYFCLYCFCNLFEFWNIFVLMSKNIKHFCIIELYTHISNLCDICCNILIMLQSKSLFLINDLICFQRKKIWFYLIFRRSSSKFPRYSIRNRHYARPETAPFNLSFLWFFESWLKIENIGKNSNAWLFYL